MSGRRRRLDVELVRRGLVASRALAREAVEAGLVTMDGAPATKVTSQVLPSTSLALSRPPRRFVSRGGGKLDHALDVFGIDVRGRRCLDAGISTGGFTHCLLDRGAAHVVGVDVGYGQVAEAVRTDERVDVRERTNIREVTLADLAAPVDLVVCDVSFISLRTVMPTLLSLLAPRGEAVLLVKPQFEAGRADVGSGGVVRDPAVWRRVLTEVADAASELGWSIGNVTTSPLPGPAGNVEFLVHVRPALAVSPDAAAGRAGPERRLEAMVAAAVAVGVELAVDAGIMLTGDDASEPTSGQTS